MDKDEKSTSSQNALVILIIIVAAIVFLIRFIDRTEKEAYERGYDEGRVSGIFDAYEDAKVFTLEYVSETLWISGYEEVWDEVFGDYGDYYLERVEEREWDYYYSQYHDEPEAYGYCPH